MLRKIKMLCLFMNVIKTKRLLLLIPIALLAIYFCAGIFFDQALVIYIKPLIIPTFMLYAASNSFKKLNLTYILFVLFFYANEVLLLFYENSIQLFRTAMVASFFCYSALLILGHNSLKEKKLYTFPKGFSLIIFGINCIFLLVVLYLLTSAVGDIYLEIIIVFNAIITVFLGATAVMYLAKYGDKRAYYYFFGTFALIFNDVFAAIGTYFIDHIVLNTMDRVLHFTSFYLIYLFLNKNKVENLSADLQP